MTMTESSHGATARPSPGELAQQVQKQSSLVRSILGSVERVVVGQREMVERLMIGLLTGGHVLLEGVPGLAKTLTVSTLARTIHAKFSRIQFTPDLLPADLVGTLIYNPRDGTFTARKGPVFANIVLADEINRAPAKVQSALLECMQERHVTIGDTTYPLESPFLVLATQNPIEQEGTYQLPEAQVDRFMLKLSVGYPSKSEERDIVDRMATSAPALSVDAVVEPREIEEARRTVDAIYLDAKIRDYIIDVVHATRDPAQVGLDLDRMIEFGASPRASIALAMAARAHAFIHGREYVIPSDVKAIGLDVLRHRVILTYEALAENVTPDQVVRRVFDHVPVP
ncbi:MAG: MoxR family ATPase [Phycisphaeraceae bacterium]|nr:MoxR family ATPase [Phycisphaeraceae bacterium]MCW5753082.1 MoxR family ATPase [Phycisphaeraceae bacterium]